MTQILTNHPYPVDIVLHPSWWYRHEGITFDKDFFYHPVRRIEVERIMETALYNRWGSYGLGKDKDHDIPWLGAVHLAAGFLVSEMLGCEVKYQEDAPPQVICAEGDFHSVSVGRAFSSPAWKRVENLKNKLILQFGNVKGDINWGGILNTALDLEGQKIFIDFFDSPGKTKSLFQNIAEVLEVFISTIKEWTGTSSISVNRSVRLLNQPVYLHSECSHTMISVEDYEHFLKSFDEDWGRQFQPYGIHYCGNDPDRFAESWSELGRLDFLDVGAGGNPAVLRKYLPNTFLNLRLDPTLLVKQTPEEIEETMYSLASASGIPMLTGFCCINLDDTVTEEQVSAVLGTAEKLRGDVQSG